MQWRGPYIVWSRVGANDYRVKIGSKTKTYHLNMLKKYIVREPKVDVVLTSKKDDATKAVVKLFLPRVIYQDTDPEMGEVLNEDSMLGEIMFGGKWRFKFIL